MANLEAPHDLSLHPIWNHAIAWTRFTGKNAHAQEEVYPVYQRFLETSSPEHPYKTPYHFPDVPGYLIRQATLEDVPLVAETLTAAGNFPRDIAYRLITDAVTDPFSWGFVWEYKGEVLQYEGTRLGLDRQCYFGHTVHIDHARPHWVWRESQKPVWDALQAAGYDFVISAVRRDREAWLPIILDMYKGKQRTVTNHAFLIEFDVRHQDIFRGWPERKTLGAWEYTEGDCVVKEATDYDAVQAFLVEQWKGRSRSKLILEMLDRWWNLDRASIIAGYRAGNLEYVRLARERGQAGRASIGALTRVTPNQEEFTRGFFEWMRQVGYQTATYFVPESDYPKTPGYDELMPKYNGKILGTRKYPKQNFLEIQYDL